jgi:hypothetical protein
VLITCFLGLCSGNHAEQPPIRRSGRGGRTGVWRGTRCSAKGARRCLRRSMWRARRGFGKAGLASAGSLLVCSSHVLLREARGMAGSMYPAAGTRRRASSLPG